MSTDVIRWGGERARLGPWRGDRGTAQLTPAPDSPPPSAPFVGRCLEAAAERGYARVVTSALSRPEQEGFLANGFQVVEELHLLTHDLEDVPPLPAAAMRRATEADRSAVLELDARAFDAFWRLDLAGLDDAIRATPRARFRLAVVRERDGAEAVVGYAITGKAGDRGYLQRLAVDPCRRRAGVGSALVVDGLRWLRRWRAHQAIVNTQVGNDVALALYQRLGFRPLPEGLRVLGRDLRP